MAENSSGCGVGGEGEPGEKEEEEIDGEKRGGDDKKIVERVGDHDSEPDGVNQSDAFQKTQALVCHCEIQGTKTECCQHESDAKTLQKTLHRAHGPQNIEMVVGHEIDQLALGLIGGHWL